MKRANDKQTEGNQPVLPPISAINYVEMIRDGGSLEASFIGANGSKYCLRFGVITAIDGGGQHVRTGYEKPVIFERMEYRHERSIGWQSNGEVEISWEHALTVLHQFRRHTRDANDERWLAIMEEIASTGGALPD